MHLCIMHLFIYIVFFFFFYLTFMFLFWVCKIQNHIKSEKLKKFGRICLSLCSFGPWSNSFNLCRTLYALDASLSWICASCTSLYALFLFLLLILLYCICLMWVKIQKHVKSEKFKKFDHVCLSTLHMWVWPSTSILMA